MLVNSPQFICEEIRFFLKENDLKHTLCPPYHPASNGLAEKYVQTFKKMLVKQGSSLSLAHNVAFVLSRSRYCNTPHTTTGQTPSEFFPKRIS